MANVIHLRSHRAIRDLSPRVGGLAARLLVTMLEQLEQEQLVTEMQHCGFGPAEARAWLVQHWYLPRGLTIPTCARCDAVIDPASRRPVDSEGKQYCGVGCLCSALGFEAMP